MSAPTRPARPRSRGAFTGEPDAQGYYLAGPGGRWRAKLHPATGQITITDTTRRARFADTDASWTRVRDWAAARGVVAAHR